MERGKKSILFQKPWRAGRETREVKMHPARMVCFILTGITASSLATMQRKAEEKLQLHAYTKTSLNGLGVQGENIQIAPSLPFPRAEGAGELYLPVVGAGSCSGVFHSGYFSSAALSVCRCYFGAARICF